MNSIIAAALLLWGVMIDVVWHDGSQDRAYDNVTAYGWVVGPGCDMWTSKLFETLSEEQKVGLVAHEIGHCLGLDHVDYDSVMRDGTFWTRPTDRDIVEMRRQFGGLENRLVIGGLASE